jgi:type VI secretion system secreted protein VgrG
MTINTNAFAQQLRKQASPVSLHKCAMYVRLALEAGGAVTAGHPIDAKDYGPLLLRNGYSKLDPALIYVAQQGDIAVIQPTSAGNRAGHIEGYDGSVWISDFIQSGFWPGPAYRKEEPAYAIYRLQTMPASLNGVPSKSA